jgi:hypothetical protein
VTIRTRFFVLVSVGILVVGLGTGLVAAYMGGFQALLGRDGPDELAYVPADVQMMAFANLREVKGSRLHDALRVWGAGGEVARIQFATGIDFDRDVDAVLASMVGAPGSRPVVLARGRFDREQLERTARQRGATIGTYRTARLYEHRAADLGLAFVDATLVVVGSPASVRRAVDVGAGEAAGARTDAALMAQLRDIDGGHAWAIVRGGADLPLPRGFGPDLPPLGGIAWFTARGQLNGQFRAWLGAEAIDEPSAQLWRDAIRGTLAIGRLQAERQPHLSGFLDSLQLGGEGRRVSLGFVVPAELFEGRHPAFAPPATGRPRPGPGEAAPNLLPRPSRPDQPLRPASPRGPRRSGGVQRAAAIPAPLTL